jgi:glycosyltransferase involved in cell wall biosynthesis
VISVVVPNYNEANVEALKAYLYILFPDAEVIVSCDFSGRGKGWALREGVKKATGESIIFIDGDLDIEPYEIKKLLPYLIQYDIVAGKKELPKGIKRKLITIASRLWIRLLFGLTIDSQTGLKAFNYKPEWVTDGYAFDMEILYKAKKMGKTMIEVPIKATVSDSKSLKDIWTTLIDSLKIRFFL